MHKQAVKQKQLPLSVTSSISYTLQHTGINSSIGHDLTPIVHNVMNSPRRPFDPATPAFRDLHFRHGFGDVMLNVRTGATQLAGLGTSSRINEQASWLVYEELCP